MKHEYARYRRLRFDGWRVVYQIFEADRIVRIHAVKPRDQDTYTSIFD